MLVLSLPAFLNLFALFIYIHHCLFLFPQSLDQSLIDSCKVVDSIKSFFPFYILMFFGHNCARCVFRVQQNEFRCYYLGLLFRRNEFRCYNLQRSYRNSTMLKKRRRRFKTKESRRLDQIVGHEDWIVQFRYDQCNY